MKQPEDYKKPLKNKNVEDEKVLFLRKQETPQSFIEIVISGFSSFDRGF